MELNHNKLDHLTAWYAHWSQAHHLKPCLGGECSDTDLCKRHNRTTDVVDRYYRAKHRRHR